VHKAFSLYNKKKSTCRRHQAKLTREVQDRRQRTDELFNKYATELLTMMRRAGHYTTAEKVDRIYENMRTEYKFFVRLNDQTDLADLMEAAEFEDLKKAQGQEIRAEKRAASTAAITATAYDRRNSYWRCKQRRHNRMNCKRPARKFCSQCGKDGVYTKDCHPLPGNATVAGDDATFPARNHAKVKYTLRPHLSVQLGRHTLQALLDTGSEISIINAETARLIQKTRIRSTETEEKIHLADGTSTQ